MDTIPPNVEDNNQAKPYEDSKARALGDTLTQMLDRRLALYHQLIALEGDIYQELVNRLQAQVGAMVSLFDTKLERKR